MSWVSKLKSLISGTNAYFGATRQELQGSGGEVLPPEVWAQVLEYSTYDDVARMARVSTSFLHQVMPLIRTLYITSEGAFTDSQAKRLQDGQLDEIIIACVFGYFGEELEIHEWVGEDKLATFLSVLPRIKSVFLAKGERERKRAILRRLGLQECTREGARTYALIDNFAKEQSRSFRDGINGYYTRTHGNIFPLDHETYAAMIRSLCKAYRTGSIPQSMKIFGLPAVHDNWEEQGCIFGGCDLCDEMCDTFPLDQVLSLKSGVKCYFPNKLGNSLDHKITALYRREGTKEAIKAKQVELFRDLLQQVEALILHFFSGEQAIAIAIQFQVMEALKNLKHIGCDPRSVVNANTLFTDACKRALKGVAACDDYGGQFHYDELEPILIMENAFNALVNEVGIDLNESDFKLMSETDPELGGIWPLSG